MSLFNLRELVSKVSISGGVVHLYVNLPADFPMLVCHGFACGANHDDWEGVWTVVNDQSLTCPDCIELSCQLKSELLRQVEGLF